MLVCELQIDGMGTVYDQLKALESMMSHYVRADLLDTKMQAIDCIRSDDEALQFDLFSIQIDDLVTRQRL